MEKRHLQHLYQRIAFGISPQELDQLSSKTKEEVIDIVFASSETTTPIVLDISSVSRITKADLKQKSVRKEFAKANQTKIKEFGYVWFDRLNNPTEVLREKMTLFWANHFVSKSKNILFTQNYNNLLREYALGNFVDFTKAVSKDSSMIDYLNNRQNRKRSPNENFARELMELFMLGRGNYTEEDITESARAFTGYNHNLKGNFIFNEHHHDENEKTFLGKTGNFNGDDIIDIIAQRQQCAHYISEKIYCHFVNEKPNRNHIDLMTEVFYGNYDIENLMRFVFLSDWFYDDENIGVQIKSPTELLVGIHKIVPYEVFKDNQLLLIQRVLGQNLMAPPNVSGWKTGRNWIDSNTIVTRLRLASILLNNAQITYSQLGNEETIIAKVDQRKLEKNTSIKTTVDWATFEKNYGRGTRNDLVKSIVISPLSPEAKSVLTESQDLPLSNFCIQILSLPEYQLG